MQAEVSCRCTFTDYPAFAVPSKHYVAFEIRSFVQSHLRAGGVSYRKGTTASAMPLFYAIRYPAGTESEDPEKESESVPALAHTTLYRWVAALATTSS